LDYCNSLLAGVADVHLCRLQSVQNAAARLVSSARRRDHVKPILATFFSQASSLSASDLQDGGAGMELSVRRSATLPGRPLCAGGVYTDGRRQSRCAVSGALLVHWTRTSIGQHSFAAYGPRTQNRLPAALRSPELSLASFKRQLKTHLFQQ